MNLTHTRGDIYRSIIEGISYGANHIIETFIDSGFIPKKLFAVGGGVKNNIWTSAVSDISGLDQIVKSNTFGAAYGNAFLAALSIRDVNRKDIDDWNCNYLTIKSKTNKIYSKQYELFKNLYKNTSGILDTW